jgi:hypothetical protein
LSVILICHADESTHSSFDAPKESFVDGIVYECPERNIGMIANDVLTYFRSLGITDNQINQYRNIDGGLVEFTLVDSLNTTDTLDLINRKEFDLKEEVVKLPSDTLHPKSVVTVSKKEILMAMLQRGRGSIFRGKSCSVEALKDQIGVRQNIVAWADSVDWHWPNGRAATWNKKYWNHGNLKLHNQLHEALTDVFIHPAKYSFGCYTASKLIELQGVVDYFRRIKHDPETSAIIERQLLQDGDPLRNIEPGSMWFFESSVTTQDIERPGKVLKVLQKVPANNFIPGDWSYFLNTDPVTYEKTGYEGSNAIYLGRGKFDDYYNDNNHSYTYKEKLNEVYQWRNHVFSRSRDAAKIIPLTTNELTKLANSPANSGLQLEYRAIPYQFGYEELPILK